VKLSKRANSRLKKVTPKNIPSNLIGAYDRHRTPRQNFRALGILSGKLEPRLAGGVEKDVSLTRSWLDGKKTMDEFEVYRLEEQDEDDDCENVSEEEEEDEEDEVSSEYGQSGDEGESVKLLKGQGRIIRDKDGNILKVVIGEDYGEIEVDRGSDQDSCLVLKKSSTSSSEMTPWGKPLEDLGYERSASVSDSVHQSDLPQGIGYKNPRRGTVEPKTKFVRDLEDIANKRSIEYERSIKNKRHLSQNQMDWIRSLMSKYRIEDVNLMVKDLKLNPYQKTQSEIQHLISRFLQEEGTQI
ncbi:ribosome biogenesis protein Nop16, partial [Phakopsora pachyrhizi]